MGHSAYRLGWAPSAGCGNDPDTIIEQPGLGVREYREMVVSLDYCSQNGGNLCRAPYYNGNPNIGPRTIGNLDQSPYVHCSLNFLNWVAVKELKLSYYIGETLFFTICTHYDNLI